MKWLRALIMLPHTLWVLNSNIRTLDQRVSALEKRLHSTEQKYPSHTLPPNFPRRFEGWEGMGRDMGSRGNWEKD